MTHHILITGGAGYIGSHTVLKLLAQGHQVTVYDNLHNSQVKAIERLETLSGKTVEFVQGDIRDRAALRTVLARTRFEAVIHFAGLKAVGESQANPLLYYDNNVNGSVILLEEMARAGVQKLVFSSSATVYGDPGYAQYREDTPVNPINVYGRTKLMVEDILRDLHQSDPQWQIALLRYFNPVGAHPSGLIGEDPAGIPNNLMPFIAQVAVGKRPQLAIFGNDYPTPDGTGLRDFIHVEDLAEGHLAALLALSSEHPLITVNLGTGRPYSVLEMVRAFEKASGKPVPYDMVSRRAGDLAEYYADPSFAKHILGWEAKRGIDEMCADTWRWQSQNPKGYAD